MQDTASELRFLCLLGKCEDAHINPFCLLSEVLVSLPNNNQHAESITMAVD